MGLRRSCDRRLARWGKVWAICAENRRG